MPYNARPAVLELIGNTPMVRVSRFDTGLCTLFLKLESQNPCDQNLKTVVMNRPT